MNRTMIAVLLVLVTISPVFGGAEDEEAVTTLTIATVNNPQMKIMEEYAPEFTAETGIELSFVVLPENELRQKVTNDVALGAGVYDIVTIGTYDTPFWGQNGWVISLEEYFDAMGTDGRNSYNRDDLLSPIRSALSYDGDQYALPFYGESSMLYYRTDIFAEAGLEIPENPTWQQVYDLATQLHDPDNGFYGISLRGLPGWGQNMAVFGTLINAFGARWFDEGWNAAFDEPEMRDAWAFYKTLLADAGQPNPTTDGYTECLTLMMNGRAAMYYDATVSAGTLEGADSQVVGNVGWAVAPSAVKDNTGWLWAWALAIESASKNKEAAFEFITWATSREYIEIVGDNVGWQQAPPGTRVSTYQSPAYQQAAPFAEIVLNAIEGADYDTPTVKPVPYVGVQYVSIPEFQSLGEFVGQQLAAYVSGQIGLDEALTNCQEEANRIAIEGGYQS